MFITRFLQDILALTPFVSPTMERFYKSADKDGFVSRFPIFGSLLNLFPPLKWIDSKFKYPILTLGRIILCGFVVWSVVQFTVTNTDYQNFVDTQIVSRFIPKPVKTEYQDIYTGNFINDTTKNISGKTANETNNLVENVKTSTFQNILKEFLYGKASILFRAPLVFLLYSLLFFLFGNTTSQLDAKALTRISGVRGIGEFLVKNIASYIPQDKLESLQKEFGTKTDTLLYDTDYQRKVLDILEKQKNTN